MAPAPSLGASRTMLCECSRVAYCSTMRNILFNVVLRWHPKGVARLKKILLIAAPMGWPNNLYGVATDTYGVATSSYGVATSSYGGGRQLLGVASAIIWGGQALAMCVWLMCC